MDTRRVMIDIETTGKTPGCNVLSIGATTFLDVEAPQGFYEKIKWDPLNPDFSDEKIQWRGGGIRNKKLRMKLSQGPVTTLMSFKTYRIIFEW
jgi:hypothetical protein